MFNRFQKMILCLIMVLSSLTMIGSFYSKDVQALQTKMNNTHILKGVWAKSCLINDGTHLVASSWAQTNQAKTVLMTNQGVYLYCLEHGKDVNHNTQYQSQTTLDMIKTAQKNTLINASRKQLLIQRVLALAPRIPDYTLYLDASGYSKSVKGNAYAWFAGQLIVWEIMVGERNAKGEHVAPTRSGAVSIVNSYNWDTQVKSNVMKYYNTYSSTLSKWDKIPSFTSSNQTQSSQYVLDQYDERGFYTVLTDTNDVLSQYTFSSGGLTFEKNGKNLTIRSQDFFNNEKIISGTQVNDDKLRSLITLGCASESSDQKTCYVSSLIPAKPSAYFKVSIETGDLKIVKKDENQKPIQNVEFKISYNADMSSPIGIYQTNEEGQIFITSLQPRPIYIQEIKTPDNYIIDTNIYTIAIESQSTVTYQAVNKEIHGKIQVIKKDSQNHLPIAQEGVIFDIYEETSNQKVDTITTNQQGKALSKDLPYGHYYVKESKAPYLYSISQSTFPVYITENDTIEKVEVFNDTIKGRLDIEKKGEVLVGYENGRFIYEQRGLKGVEFQIIAEEDIIDPQTKKSVYHKNDVVKTVKTDKEGKVSVDLLLGTYRVKESQGLKGYVLLEHDEILHLTTDDSSQSLIVKTLPITNQRQKIDVNVVKTDSLTKLPMQNALIGLYAAEDIKNNEGKILVYQDQLIESLNTNEEGKITFQDDLPLASYYLKEIKAPQGYRQQEQRYDINLSLVNQTQEIIHIVKEIANVPTVVTITKTDLSSKELPGAHLQIIDASTNEVVEEWISTNQPHIIYNLIIDKPYILKEILAPDGYVTSEEIPFIVGKEGVNSLVMKNDYSYVSIIKVDEKKRAVNGAILQLIDPQTHKIIDEWTSGTKGHLIKGLTVGKTYLLHEKQSPKGYIKSNDQEVVLKNQTGVQDVFFENRREIVQTYDSQLVMGYFIVGMMSYVFLMILCKKVR